MPPTFKSLTGQRFGRLVAERFAGRAGGGKALWECLCDCGARTVVRQHALSRGTTRSCGCYARENPPATKHGLVGTPEYGPWAAMRERCMNPRATGYHNYGGRGIRICDAWSDPAQFVKDMGPRPAGGTIDRIDVNGNYEPGNCRWVSLAEQPRNRRNSRTYTHDGRTLNLREWSRLLQISRGVLEYWVGRKGEPLSEIIQKRKTA